MIVFLQLICMPFFPLPLPAYPPVQAMVISVIGLGVISFGGNLLLWALSVPRRFSVRSAVFKACIGIVFIALEYPGTRKDFVVATTQASYTITTCLIVQDCQRYASQHGGHWPQHLGPNISSWVVSCDGADHCRIDVERNNPQALPLTVVYHMPKTTKENEIVMEAVNPVPGCGYAVVSQDCALKWKASTGLNLNAAQRIGQQHSLREEFDEAGRVVQQIGIEKVISELESSGVSTEASQVLAVEAARRTKDARLKPFLKQIAGGGGPVSKFAEAALREYSD